MPHTPLPYPLHPLVIELDDLFSELYESSASPSTETTEKLSALQLKISARLFALEAAQRAFAACGTE